MNQLSIAERTRLRDTHLNAAQKPEGEFIPYSPDEKRAADYIDALTGCGGGSDPIGFLIASHSVLVQNLRRN